MTKKYIKNFSAEYKTKVVLELLESEVTISQLSKKYEITPKTIQNWSVFVRVFCKSVLFYTMVETFSHKSSIVSLLSVNPFSFPFSTLLSFTLEP